MSATAPGTLRRYLIRRILIITGLLTIPSSRLVAQSRTTQTGVYSAEQAARGEDVYAGMCKSCHAAATHTGVAFEKSWDGRSLSELFGYTTSLRGMSQTEMGLRGIASPQAGTLLNLAQLHRPPLCP